jgi:AcrR family transcriptional regulator
MMQCDSIAKLHDVPRVVDHDERRREITYAVWYLLATRGPDAVSLRSVAAEAGVSVGRIQHYFASKQDLLRHGCAALTEVAAEAFGSATGDDVPDDDVADGPLGELWRLVVQVVPTTEAFRLGTAVWFAYLALSPGNPEIAGLMAQAKRGQEQRAAALLERAVEVRQARRKVDVLPTVRGLLATADGLAVRVLVGDLTSSEALDLLGAELAGLRRGERSP